MDSSSSDGEDFIGFTDAEIEQSGTRVGEIIAESDIDVSDVESDVSFEELNEFDDPALDNLGAEWSNQLQDFQIGDFSADTGPAHNLNATATQLDYLSLFLPSSFFENVAEETNKYATQQQAAHGPDPKWLPTSADEVKAYFAINILMGVKQLPRLWCYWSTDKRYRDEYISSIMPRLRFQKLNQYLHVRDTSNTPPREHEDYDPLFKIRPVLEEVRARFGSVYNPGKNLSVDEAMIGFKGRIFFRQYMPAKPTKWGIKVWEICESDSGYCLNFDVYTGKKRDGCREHGLGYDVVWKLSEPYHNKYHHLYYDRFFSSVILAEHLNMVNTYTCGTIMNNRKGLPPAVRQAKLKKEGELVQVQKGNLLATVYKDKRQLSFLSTSVQPFRGEGKPTVNMEYNANMGGVDKSDQYRSYYPVGRPGKKWWRYLLWFVVNLSIVNSWILYSRSRHDPPPPKGYDHLRFRMDVVEQLVNGFSSRKYKSGRRSNSQGAADGGTANVHTVEKMETKRVCRECSKAGRKTPAGRQIVSTFKCGFCNVALCRVGCFTAYHDKYK